MVKEFIATMQKFNYCNVEKKLILFWRAFKEQKNLKIYSSQLNIACIVQFLPTLKLEKSNEIKKFNVELSKTRV